MRLPSKNTDFSDLCAFYLQVITFSGIDTACQKLPELVKAFTNPRQGDDAYLRTQEQIRVLVLCYAAELDLDDACRQYAYIVSTNSSIDILQLTEDDNSCAVHNTTIIAIGMIDTVCSTCGYFANSLSNTTKHAKCSELERDDVVHTFANWIHFGKGIALAPQAYMKKFNGKVTQMASTLASAKTCSMQTIPEEMTIKSTFTIL